MRIVFFYYLKSQLSSSGSRGAKDSIPPPWHVKKVIKNGCDRGGLYFMFLGPPLRSFRIRYCYHVHRSTFDFFNREMLTMIAMVQESDPSVKIVVWDLGFYFDHYITYVRFQITLINSLSYLIRIQRGYFMFIFNTAACRTW